MVLRPVLCRVLASMERMVAYLLEAHRGALPLWLSPWQVAVLPVSADQSDAARRVRDASVAAGLRAEVDDRDESLAARVRAAQQRKIPYVAVVGPREAADGSVALRSRDGDRLPPQPIAEAVRFIAAAADSWLQAGRRPAMTRE